MGRGKNACGLANSASYPTSVTAVEQYTDGNYADETGWMETTPVIKDNPSHNYADETSSDMLDFHPAYLTMVREALETKRVREAKASTVKELLAADDIPSKVKELFASDDIPSKLKEFIAANGMPKWGK